MPNLKRALKNKLKGARRVAVLGIGSILRQDDAAGILVAESLSRLAAKSLRKKKFKVFLGHTSAENLTGEIKNFNPSHVVIIDAADFGKPAGFLGLIQPQQVKGISFSTHRLPPSLLAKYLILSLNCRVILIGIQPKSLEFNQPVSARVKKSITNLANCLFQAL